ncbi:MAG: galactose-1-phosphate uridylyltransferase [Actinocatenispora sp.]
MKRTPILLADGRELIYFDESDDTDRGVPDRRELPEPPVASELRYDPVLDEWVAVAAHRQDRTFLPPSDQCPLCPSSTRRATEVPAEDYDVVVFENRFPSFSHRLGAVQSALDGGLVPAVPGQGRCELVCFTADHNSSFSRLSPARVRTVIEAWADRTTELAQLPGIEQVFCFENRGEEIGVTLHHPHGQIYGYPYVTPRTVRILDSARRYTHRTGGRSLFADLLAAERADERVVAGNEHWTAFVPAAARWPFEVHLYPHRQVPDIPSLDAAERDAFADLYLDVLGRFDRVFDAPLPYISAWHQAPVRADRHLAYLHLQLFSLRRAPGKLKYLAGSESAMGAFVNDIRPEQAAQTLRES